jgi:predicted RNase H-like nuclease
MTPAAVGIDGCSGGWVVAAWAPGGVPRLFTLERLEALGGTLTAQGLKPSRQLIDMPIGLPLAGPRPVDQQAQAALGAARASIFITPPRPVLDALNFEEAQRLARAALGQGLSLQAWNLVPKIRAVDRFLRRAQPAPPCLEEAHPELAFQRLNAGQGGAPLPSKKTSPGAAARSALLEALGLPCAAVLAAPLTCEGRRVALDDRLDALVLAYLASLPEHDLECLGAGDVDALGLPMTLLAPKART